MNDDAWNREREDGFVSFLRLAPSCAEHGIAMLILGLTIDRVSVAYAIWR
jgi:hypothetical protein